MRPTSRTRAAAAAAAGFTLLELLVVMSLLGVLAGFGIGFLQNTGSDRDLALAQIRDTVRIAALTARTRHLPTEVVVQRGDESTPTRMRARVLAPVGNWHLEPDERWLSEAVTASVFGEIVPGRFGMARRFEEGQRDATVIVSPDGSDLFDFSDGFAARVDVYLEARDPMTALRFGTGLELTLDGNLVPAAKMVTSEGGQPGPAARVQGVDPLRLHRWITLEVVHDGSRLYLAVDGLVVDETPVSRSLYQTDRDQLTVSPADEPVVGVVDEIAMLAYELSDLQELPLDVELQMPANTVIEFDRRGRLRLPVTFRLTETGQDATSYRIGPGGVIE